MIVLIMPMPGSVLRRFPRRHGLSHSLRRLDREVIGVVQRIIECVMVRARMIPLGIPGELSSQTIQLALEARSAVLSFTPCQVDAFKVRVFLLQSGLGVL
jgi:hypothetical protein